MKRAIKKLAAVILYLLVLCFLLKAKVILLFSPKHIGMFLLGCVILCVPYMEKGTKWKGFGIIFKKNAIIAGYLESFMLIFVSMIGKERAWEMFPAEFALDLRPLFYGFVCYMVFKEESETREQEEILKQTKEERMVYETAHEIKKNLDLSKLTKQEKIITEMISQGLTNREIGEELCISETTVKKHVSNIFAKLEISSRKELKF